MQINVLQLTRNKGCATTFAYRFTNSVTLGRW